DPAFRFQDVVGVLETQEIAFGQTEELAQTQIGIAGDVARAVDDGMDAITRNADRLSQLILAYSDLVEEILLENLAWVRIAKLSPRSAPNPIRNTYQLLAGEACVRCRESQRRDQGRRRLSPSPRSCAGRGWGEGPATRREGLGRGRNTIDLDQ